MLENCEFETIVERGLLCVRDLSTGRLYPIVSGGEGDEDDDDKEKDEEGKEDEEKDDDEPGEEASAKDDGDDEEDDDAKDDDTERDANDKGGKGVKGLQKRLSKVSARLRAYKQNGSPEEFAALKSEIAKYKKYEKEIEDEERQRIDADARKKGLPTVEQQNAQLDRLLTQRFGEGAPDDFASYRETRQRDLSRHVRDGQDHLRKLLTEHGLGAIAKDPKAFAEWDRQIGAAIRKNPERLAAFRNPLSVTTAIDDAFKDVKRRIIDPAVAVSSAGKIKSLARRRDAAPVSAGRSSAPTFKTGESKPPDNLKGRARTDWWDKRLQDVATQIDESPDSD